MISVISNTKVAILVLSMAVGGWAWYNQYRNNILEAEVLRLEIQLEHAMSMDELNKSIARANQSLLTAAIDTQNEAIDKMVNVVNDSNQVVLYRLGEQQKVAAAQYKTMETAINGMNIDTCESLMDALVTFPGVRKHE